MACFVLVHGVWGGGFVWREVAPLLRTAGHDVHTPTLTGLGERAHLLHPDIDLDTHVQDLVNTLFYRDLRDVILVGWSYGGMPVTGAAEQVPDRIQHLVYLDADVPFDGETKLDLNTPERRAWWQDLARTHGDGWRAPLIVGDDYQRDVIADEALRQWLLARSKGHAQPFKTMTQPLRVRDPVAQALPRTFIDCTADGVDVRMAERARTSPGWRYRELDASHFALATHPHEVVDLLLEVV